MIPALVLAAGLSRRSGATNKLLTRDRSGRAMLERTVDAVLGSRAGPVLVVTGHQADEIRGVLADRPVLFVHAQDYATGMAASLRAGLAALPADCAGALVCLGDMPLVTADAVDALIAVSREHDGTAIVVPVNGGRRGNPVLWASRYFSEMMALEGDAGARSLLARHADKMVCVECAEGVLMDFDQGAGAWQALLP